MKVALCLYGLIGASGDKCRNAESDPKVLGIGYKHYKRHLFDKNDVDVFVHTWDVSLRKEIVDLYQPKLSVIEKQIDFLVHRNLKCKDANQGKSHFSRWYSAKISTELKRKYEQNNNFQYDAVMSGRFDQAWEIDIEFDKIDLNYFYTGYWCDLRKGGTEYFQGGKGPIYGMKSDEVKKLKHKHLGYPDGGKVLDFWFFSNSKYMDKFGTLYDRLSGYYAKGKKLYGGRSLRISNHVMPIHHLDRIGLLPKFRYMFHAYDDFPMVRRKYLKCRI